MNIHSLKDTIAAIATPRGIGAIAIVRMTGDRSEAILEKFFKGNRKISTAALNTIIPGYLYRTREKEEILDRVLVLKFKAPHSYTGEDVMEIHCHGGLCVVQEALNLLLENGARLAEPGEFTQRAFLNGKMDLVQAEAVEEVINAQTRESLKLSFSQHRGILSEKLKELKDALIRQSALLEMELDFSTEDIEFADREEIKKQVAAAIYEVERLIQSYRFGRILREGVHTVIAGRTNVGKSSILNRLLEEERAIVTDVPGTTRDSIEESLDIEGILFKITDTAGLRETTDKVEEIGVQRTMRLLENADIVLFVVDGSKELDGADLTLFKNINAICRAQETRFIIACNKSDLAEKIDVVALQQRFSSNNALKISAKTGDGFDNLKRRMRESIFGEEYDTNAILISKQRHKNELEKAKECLVNARESLKNNLSPEFISLDVRGALNHIGEITGEVTSQDILREIFSSFCIGK
jgi:tRNA modification GTPase